MPKTLKQLLDQVNGEQGFDIPASYIGSTDSNIVQLVAVANKSAKTLRDLRLQLMVRQAVIDMTTGITDSTQPLIKSYALPSDYYCAVSDTLYQFGRIDQAMLVTPAPFWAYLRSRSGPQGLRVECRIMNGRLAIFSPENSDPTTAATASRLPTHVDFEYISSYPINQFNTSANTASKSTDFTPGDSFLTDNDVWLLDDPLFEFHVKWKYCQAKGLEGWQEYKNDYQLYENELRGRDKGAQTISWPGAYPYPNAPYINLWRPE